ncbi:MAG: hypothetical protein ABJF10_19480 [Chthoniobacter sp.]|uniref:hypothetical protein n=1 Tax=Chthoniobacter sp. TaxID=2510640 RepID=UPI0032A9A930
MSKERDDALVELIVRESVERIDEERPHPWLAPLGLSLLQQCVEQWIKEAFGLAAARSGGDDHVLLLCDNRSQGILLVLVQWPLKLAFWQTREVPMEQRRCARGKCGKRLAFHEIG